MTSKIKVNILADGGDNSIITSDGAGSFTASSSLASSVQSVGGIQNTPAFKYVKTSVQTVSDNTFTKVTFDNGILDTDSAVSSSTFTVPTGKGGQYLIGANLFTGASGVTRYIYGNLYIVVNGTFRSQCNTDFRNSYYTYTHNLLVSDILDLSAGDTVEIQGRINDSTSSPNFLGDTTNYQTYFYGFKLIGA
jgi:hypothetical protein